MGKTKPAARLSIKAIPAPAPAPVVIKWLPLTRVELTEEMRRSPKFPPWLKEAYRNNVLWVQVQYHDTDWGPVKHLYVSRIDGAPLRDWNVLQRVKTEVCGAEIFAVEVFPPESEVCDSANIYHLWAFEPGFRVPFGLLPPDMAKTKPRSERE
jgi:hypothetical protein